MGFDTIPFSIRSQMNWALPSLTFNPNIIYNIISSQSQSWGITWIDATVNDIKSQT